MDNSILKTRRKESRADEIINCATQLFLKNGFEKTTFSDIAKEGGMARSTIYLYFKDKNDILKSIIHFCFENHRSLLEAPDLEKTQTLSELFDEAVIAIEKLFDEKEFIMKYQMIINLAIKHPDIAKIMNEESILPTKKLWAKQCERFNVDKKNVDYFFSTLFSIFLSACVTNFIYGRSNPLIEFKEFSRITRMRFKKFEEFVRPREENLE